MSGRVEGNIFGHHVDVKHEREFYNLPYLISPLLPKKIIEVAKKLNADA